MKFGLWHSTGVTGRIFRLGQKVRVRVADADKMLKTVDFELVSDIWDTDDEIEE